MPTMLSSPNASENRLMKRSFQRMARRGSLPLKKRRFRLLEPTTAEPSAFSLFTPVSSQHPHAMSTNGGILPLLQQPHQPSHMDSSSFATAASLSNSSCYASTATGTIHDTENSASRSNTSTMKSPPPAASLTKLSLMAAAAASRSRLRTHEDAEDASSSWVPITPATHQQPVGGAFRKALTNSPTPTTTTTTTYKPSPGRSHKKKTVPPASSLMAPLTPGRTQQDKRYTGTGDPSECRCRATTTRGRACAYIAVAPTPYCYLHADYATSPPPPRRYNSSGSSSSGSSNGSSSKSSSKPSATAPSLPMMMSSNASSSSSNKPTRRRTSAKLAEKHAAATAPLLSMISTDQWHHKAVRIALGPLTGRTGRVEKWGNGWVSVQLDGTAKNGSEGGGWHNRRSFELVLLDEGAVANTSAAATTTTTTRPQTPKIAKEAAVVAAKVTPHSADHPKPNKNVMALQVEHGMVVDLRLPKDTKTKGAALQPRESTTTTTATASHLVQNDDEEQESTIQ